MNPYAMLGSAIGTNEAASLTARLSAWHDAMVAHERRLRAGTTDDVCDDECPHAEARALWSEAVETFGTRARELAFLRSRANGARRAVVPARAESAGNDGEPPRKAFRTHRATEAAHAAAEL